MTVPFVPNPNPSPMDCFLCGPPAQIAYDEF